MREGGDQRGDRLLSFPTPVRDRHHVRLEPLRRALQQGEIAVLAVLEDLVEALGPDDAVLQICSIVVLM